jgi:hypothetical protein
VGKLGSWVSRGGTRWKKTLTVEGWAENFFDSTFLTAGGSITGMNTSSSQTELVQSWGLGHSSLSREQNLFHLQEKHRHSKKFVSYWVIGSLSMRRSHKLDVMYQRLSLPLTWFKLFLAMKILGCVHKPGTVKFIVFNVQSFSCEKDTSQSTLDSWWRLKNNADLLVNFPLCP